jgi:rhamnose utilization protein RhaD (predicted bifunctional aldolase and dehydrogenase)
MKSLYDETKAKKFENDPLALRVYTSQLLGVDSNLVLHGGGNTSVKIDDTLYVKGSGWDLATIQKAGFSPVDLKTLQAMATREALSDAQMVKEQRAALRDESAPNPSIEAILHANIPYAFVDHTHTDAVVTISNTPNGKKIIEELYGPNVLVVDYVMPGFILAKEIYNLTKDLDWDSLEAIILLNHGVFTFNDDAQKSYERMIEIVSTAEAYLDEQTQALPVCQKEILDPDVLDELRQKISALRESEIYIQLNGSDEACYISRIENLHDLIYNGPLTPEHVIRTKPFPLVVDDDVEKGLFEFINRYTEYYETYKSEEHIMLDVAPRYAIVKGIGLLTFGKDEKEASVIMDIATHTVHAMIQSLNLGGWKSLSPKDIFDMEYWELEQAKLKK